MTLREEVKSHVQYAEDRGDISLNFVHDQLDNIAKLISNEEFINEFKEALNDIVDQNDNGKLDSEDIKLLAEVFVFKKKNLGNLMTFSANLIKTFINLLAKFEQTEVKYDADAVEAIFFGVFGYVLYTQVDDSEEDKNNIADLVVSVYNVIKSVDETFDILEKAIKMMKKCSCLSGDKLGDKLKKNKNKLKQATENIKETARLERELKDLKQQMGIVDEVKEVEEDKDEVK